MNKTADVKVIGIIHLAANIVAFCVLGAFLIYLLINYSALPERIGVHFSAIDGQYDVFAGKWLSFYPFVVGFGLLGILSLLTLAVNKVRRIGVRVNEKGDKVLRTMAMLIADAFKLMIAGFFSYWTYCIVHQTGMDDGTTLMIFRSAALNMFFLLPIPIIVIAIIFRPKKGEKNDNSTGN